MNLATERARVRYEPARATVAWLRVAVEKPGYSVRDLLEGRAR